MREKTIEQIEVKGGLYTVARWANPGAKPLLLVHGITGTHMAWPLLVDALAHDYDIYAPDLRGRGGSADLPGPFGLAAHVEDLIAILDAYGLTQVDYAGHSLGAYIGLEFAAIAGERLHRIVLIDGGIALPLPAGMEPEAVIEALLGPAIKRLDMNFESVEAYREFWQQHPAFKEVSDWSLLMNDFIDYDITGTPPALRSGVNPEAVREDGAGPLAVSMLSRIDEATQQMLLLTAPRGLQNQPEPMMPVAAVEHKVAGNDRLQHIEIPDCNHYTIVMGSGAQPVARAMDDFLGSSSA